MMSLRGTCAGELQSARRAERHYIYTVAKLLANLRCVLFVLKIQPRKVCSTDPGVSKPVFDWLKEKKQKPLNKVNK